MSDEKVKKYILEKYPQIKFNNGYFLNEKAINEFSIDIIAEKLSQLNNNEAFKLSLKLDISSSIPCINPMLKYIIEKNIDFFKETKDNPMDDASIIKEYTRIYSRNDFSIEQLKKVELENLKENKDKNFRFLGFDINYYNELIIIQKLYKERKIKYNDIKVFIEFTFELLKNNIIRETGNYEQKYDTYINEIISHLLIGNITPNSLYDCMNNIHKINNLLIVSKFGKLIYKLAYIPTEIISSLKGNQIKKIYNELYIKISKSKKINNSYNEEELLTTLITMYVLLGIDNVTKIVKNVPEDENKIKRLLDSFKNIDLSNVNVKGNSIVNNNQFINFFMGDNLNEPNSLLNLIYEGKTHLNDKIEVIYAYWDLLDTRYKNQKLNTRLAFLEENLNTNKIILNPDEYKLEGSIVNSYYDNKKFQNLNNLELIEKLREEYSKMKHNYQKTIPYVNGEYQEYYYETLMANDPNLFIAGSSTDNCFKIGGDADSFVKYCAHNENGRVLVVKDKQNNIIAMAPMIRNGNLIICNSIESEKVRNKGFMKAMFEILEEFGNKIIAISNKNEKDEEKIKILIVGDYKNEISQFDKYETLKYGQINEEFLGPINKTEYIYSNMGSFDYDNYIISKAEGISLNSLKSFSPSIRYNDPRKEVIELEKEHINEDTKKIINSIYYEKNHTILDLNNIEKVIYNDDWFILIDNKYNMITACTSKDPRAILEYEEYLEIIKEHISYYDENGHIKDDAKYNYKK